MNNLSTGKQWIHVVIATGIGAFVLQDIIRAILRRLPMTPHYRISNDVSGYFEQIVNDDMTMLKSIMHELIVLNTIIEYGIAVMIGLVVGRCVTHRIYLAAVLAVLPIWIINNVFGLFIADGIASFINTIRGEERLVVHTIAAVGIKLPVIVLAILTAMVTRRLSQKAHIADPHNCTMARRDTT